MTCASHLHFPATAMMAQSITYINLEEVHGGRRPYSHSNTDYSMEQYFISFHFPYLMNENRLYIKIVQDKYSQKHFDKSEMRTDRIPLGTG